MASKKNNNDAIAQYRTVLAENADYSDDEVKAFYDAHVELFGENAEVTIAVEEATLESLELPLFVNDWIENTET